MSKRKPINEHKLQRIKLLDRQNELNEKHCKPCDTFNSADTSKTVCEGCKVYKELKSIGELYEKINSKERQERLMAQITLEKYNDLKAQGKTDSFIMGLFSMNSMQLNAWKKKHDLVKPRAAKPQEEAPKEQKVVIARAAVEENEAKFKQEIEALKGEKTVMAQKYLAEIEELKASNQRLSGEKERLTEELEKTLAGLEDCNQRFEQNLQQRVDVLKDQLNFALNKASKAEAQLKELNQFKLMLMKDYVQMAEEDNR